MASRRGYLDQTELAQFADITIDDTTEADDRISQAEELIDAYVGFQEQFIEDPITGVAVGGSTTTIQLAERHQNTYQKDYFKGCEVEIIGGSQAGSRRRITGSTYAGVLTTDAFGGAIADGSVYRIYQLGKFPRCCDVYYDSISTETYYKQIPEAVKRATAAQVEYMINMGDDFFRTDKSELESESIGDYSYSKGSNRNTLIAPKAKALLRGIFSRIGAIVE